MTPYSEPLSSPQARPAVSPFASLQSEKLRAANIFAPVLIGLALFWLLVPLLTVDNPSTGMSLAAATASGAIGLTVCLEMMVRANILTRGLMLFDRLMRRRNVEGRFGRLRNGSVRQQKKEPPGNCLGAVPPRRSRGGSSRHRGRRREVSFPNLWYGAAVAPDPALPSPNG